MSSKVGYLVFDIESIADPPLVAKLKYPGENISPQEAVQRFRDERMEAYGSDFIPYSYQVPISIAVAKVGTDFVLNDLVVLDQPEYRPHVMTEHFWRGWEAYGRPTLVTFNGRNFDVPLLELSAFRYGISIPGWFSVGAKSFNQPRYRYNTECHLDLCELLTNFGTTRFSGGLNLAANLLGKPGKMDVEGHMVQDMYEQGNLEEINNYCRCDVLDTYFVFLRTQVLLGRLTLEREQEIVTQTRKWLTDRADGMPAYRLYLGNWGEWKNPWEAEAEEPANTPSVSADDIEGIETDVDTSNDISSIDIPEE